MREPRFIATRSTRAASRIERCIGAPFLASIFGAIAVVGCKTTAPADEALLRVPGIETGVTHYAGSPLSGVAPAGAAAAIDGEPEHALHARCEIAYVEREVSGDLAPVTSRARLLAGVRGDEPIRSTSELATEARVASGTAAEDVLGAIDRMDFGRVRRVAALDGALPEGVTVVFAASAHEVLDSQDFGRVQKRVEFEITRGVGEARDDVMVALATEDLAPERKASSADADATPRAAPARRVLRREYVVLDDRLTIGGGAIAVVFPSPFSGGDGRTFAVRLTVEPPPSRGESTATDGDDSLALHSARVARCLRDVVAAEQRANELARPLGAAEARKRKIAGAMAELQSHSSRRAALIMIAGEAQADLCGDFALACADETLDAFLGGLGGALQEGELGFAMERATLAFLAARKSAAALEPELDAVLVRYTGELGRSAGGIEDLLARATDLASLRAHATEENRVFLEDSSLTSRVRAFDWLAAHGAAPPGYDPLASAESRRKALDAAESAPKNGGGQ